MPVPVLYSFRRCPFAIRARMALVNSGVRVELREVRLNDMPACMLEKSPKATVPVLVLDDGRVLDESLDVMDWSLAQSDPQEWRDIDAVAERLIRCCDEDFKPLLDRYKYADRHPESTELEHRVRAEAFVLELERLLACRAWLSGERCALADVAVFPFIRQFAGVDAAWFDASEYARVRQWLNAMLDSDLFRQVMGKQPFWRPGDAAVYL